MSVIHHLNEPVKHTVDVLALGALVATFLDWMPALTAVMVFAWTGMRIFESWQNIQINRRKLKE